MSPLELFSDELEGLVRKAAPAVVAIEHRRGHGTGVGIAPDGFVLTNAHVVQGAGRVRARLHDSTVTDCEVVGRDPATDLAVVKTSHGLEALTLTEAAEVKVGQVVLALGHPFGFERSVSLGVVSALERRLPGRDGASLDGLIQTDAAINPGNSGGPLLNVRGRVVGINTAMLPFAQGIGFAVPAFTASWVAALLIRNGEVRRRFLGVAAKNETFAAELALRLGQPRGVRIVEIGPDTPAAAAGLERDDVVLQLNTTPVTTVDDLQRQLALETATVVDLTVWKREERVRRQIRPRNARATPAPSSSPP